MRAHLTLLVLLLATPLAGAASERTFDVRLLDQDCPAGQDRFCILPDTIETRTDETLALQVRNTGHVNHSLVWAPGTPEALAQYTTGELPPNGTATLRIPVQDLQAALEASDGATFVLQCALDGHATLGERAELVLTPAQGAEERPQPLGSALAALALVAGALVARRVRRD